jgi:rod shape-determining protein MreC
MASARIVTDSRGPFANSRLANAGSEAGIRPGNPVMSENGLVGRIVGVTKGASRVLLLTDVASRTPVMIDRTNARAILTGDGGPNPKLEYLRGQNPVKSGDLVLTSGDGGVFPRGLPVGVAVKGLDGRWRVVLASDKAPVDFVRILLFEDFTQVVNRAALEHAAPPPPTPGAETLPPPQPETPAVAAAAAPAPGATPPAKTDAAKPADATTAAKAPAPKSAATKPAEKSPAAKPTEKAPAVKPAEKAAATKTSTAKAAADTATKPASKPVTAPKKPASDKTAATASAAAKSAKSDAAKAPAPKKPVAKQPEEAR